MFLKNKITGSIGKFANLQGDDWIELTQSEIDAYELAQTQKEKISEIKSTAASLILAIYPFYKQLNILMSKDANLIEEMNESILAIRNKSNELEAALDLLKDGKDGEKIKNFKIEF